MFGKRNNGTPKRKFLDQAAGFAAFKKDLPRCFQTEPTYRFLRWPETNFKNDDDDELHNKPAHAVPLASARQHLGIDIKKTILLSHVSGKRLF